MPTTESTFDSGLTVSPPMQKFIDYFAELGPRWGVKADTSSVHALLFLAGRPLDRDEVAGALGISKAKATNALKDLLGWEMGYQNEEGRWLTGGEPWDLLFTALDSRRQREIKPALEVLRACTNAAATDPDTPDATRRRISGVLSLVENLAAIDLQSRRLPKNLLPRLVTATGTASRMLDRFMPRSHRKPGHATE